MPHTIALSDLSMAELAEQACGYELTEREGIPYLEELQRKADLAGHTWYSFLSRLRLVFGYVYALRAEKSLALLPQVLAQHDADPAIMDAYWVLWAQKVVTDCLADFPSIPRHKIMSCLEDLGERLQRHGYSPYTYHHLKGRLLASLGEPTEAAANVEQRNRHARDEISDCEACVVDSDVELYAVLRDDERAYRLADPILRGKLSCEAVPKATYEVLMSAALRLKRWDEARDFHLKASRLLWKDPADAHAAGIQMVFLARTEHAERGLKFLERYMPAYLETLSTLDKVSFESGAHLVLARLQQRRTRSTVKLRLTPKAPFHQKDGSYDLQELAAWFHAQAQQRVATLDQRNGNDYFRRDWEDEQAMLATDPLPYGSP